MTSPSGDSLGDRMKEYEQHYRLELPRRTWTVVRVDGRSFHTWTRGLERPFSIPLVSAMGECMKALCADMSGTVIAYAQSDEISVVLSDFGRQDSQPYFGGVVQKIVSVAASVATAQFNRTAESIWVRNPRRLACFDARVFSLPDRDEVRNYLLWRQQDAQRNAISMIASAHFSHKQLEGKSIPEREAMLASVDIHPSDYDQRCMNGQVCYRERKVSDVTWYDSRGLEHLKKDVERWAWTTDKAPKLDCQPGTFLDAILPADPAPLDTRMQAACDD